MNVYIFCWMVLLIVVCLLVVWCCCVLVFEYVLSLCSIVLMLLYE